MRAETRLEKLRVSHRFPVVCCWFVLHFKYETCRSSEALMTLIKSREAMLNVTQGLRGRFPRHAYICKLAWRVGYTPMYRTAPVGTPLKRAQIASFLPHSPLSRLKHFTFHDESEV